MKAPVFYRNINARDHLEVFFVSAISSLLLVRFYLYATGYPQVGNGSLHIAHMLYGGLLMMLAIVMILSLIGRRTEQVAAILGGVGFGVFIDELGKFITRDNNYFFRPTLGIIYAIFVSLYLLFNFLSKTTKLSSAEYLLNALVQLEEAVHQDLDASEKRQIKFLLDRADQSSPTTQELQKLIIRLNTVATTPPSNFHVLLRRLNSLYLRFWRKRNSNKLIGFLFVLESVIFLLIVMVSIYNNFDSVQEFFASHQNNYGQELIIGQLISSIIVAGYAVMGAYRIHNSRAQAFELFRRATLVNIFLTEFFIFARIQFGAIPSLLVNLLLFVALRYALHQENYGAVTKSE